MNLTQRLRKVLSLVGIQVIVVVVLLEGALRVLRPYHQGLNMMLYAASVTTAYDHIDTLDDLLKGTLLGYAPQRLRAGFILNSRSFRTIEYEPAPSPDTLRIVALGDSFTFDSGGVAYDAMWTTICEAQLRDMTGKKLELLSLGVPGVGPMFALRLWELEGVKLQPDLVILAFFVGNDFTDEQHHRLKPRDSFNPVEYCYTVRLIKNIYRLRSERKLSIEWPEAPPDDPVYPQGGVRAPDAQITRGAFSEGRYYAIEAQRLELALKSHRPRLESLAKNTEIVLARLNQEVTAVGAKLLVLIIPDEYQVDRDLLTVLLARTNTPRGEVELAAPQTVLKALCDKHRIRYLDLLPSFIAEAEAGPFYWFHNTHWNHEGNRLAGEKLTAYLVENQLIEPK